MGHRRTLIALGLALAWACSDDDENSPPPVNGPDGGTAGDSGGNSGRSGAGGSSPGGSASGEAGSDAGGSAGAPGGEGGAPSGGTAGTGAEGGTGGTAGTSGSSGTGGAAGYPACPSDDETDPPTLSSTCDVEGLWGPSVDLPLLDGAAQLLAITPDELTIAWFGVANMDTTFHVADRAATNVDFDAGQQLEVLDFVALSPDGLRLALVSDGRLQERVRTAKTQPFGAPAEGSFATLDANAEQNDLTLFGGVISPDDRNFFYLVSDGTDDQPLRVLTRTGTEAWPVGTPIESCEFQTEAGVYRQPTGVSADNRTLFFVDYVRGQTRAAFRASVSSPFAWFVDLGTRDRAQPNATCDRLYFTATGGPAYAAAQ